MDFVKTQLGQVVEQVKMAMLAHTPVVYIPTDQKELILELLYGHDTGNSLIPRVSYSNEEKKIKLMPLEYYGIYDGDRWLGEVDNYLIRQGIPKSITHPHIFVDIISTLSDTNLLNVKKFIDYFLGFKDGAAYSDPQKVNLIRRSLYIIVTPQEQTIPADLAPYVKTIHIPGLSDTEIFDIVNDELKKNGIDKSVLKQSLITSMKESLRGFSARRIRNIIDRLVATQDIDYDGALDNKVLEEIRTEKKQMLEGSNGLKWEVVGETNAAGLESIQVWVNNRKSIFEDIDKAKQKHIDIPKGLLISGIPGSGKSLMAKDVASKLNLPLISLDMGAMLGGIMGESEHNMINALSMADKMAPCVLWIDEIEKAFSGSSQSSSSSDGGVGRRMFGKFLTWMQEKSSACFVFATSNDITCLPPELFRSERFDKKFFTFMPMAMDCAKIFAANIHAQNEKYEKTLDQLSSEERSGMPGSLFPDDLALEETWLPILDSCCSNNSDPCSLVKEGDDTFYHWKSGKRPTNKLFTGADISAIIKEAKFEVSSKSSSNRRECVYDGKLMLQKVKEVIEVFQPYGETNLHDIVKCFRLLYQNRFESAAGGCIVDFNHYNEDKRIYETSSEELSGFIHTYDKVLFSTIVGAINYYSNDNKKGDA